MTVKTAPVGVSIVQVLPAQGNGDEGPPLNCIAPLPLPHAVGVAFACCENIPTPMDDVTIVKTAVVATIASSIRVFILYINLA